MIEPDPGFLDLKERKMYDLVAHWHTGHQRKYTGAPYVVHLLAVARTIKEQTGNLVQVAAALGHDLFEDTACREAEVRTALTEAEYTSEEQQAILDLIWELTDQFTKEQYPALNRRQRKANEVDRLAKISKKAQTIKYADLIDNTLDIGRNDPDFAKVFLRETERLLQKMNRGDFELYARSIQVCGSVREQLAENSPETLVSQYLEFLTQSDLEGLLTLFSEEAVVYSPRYGKRPVRDFYEELFRDTERSELKLYEVFQADSGNICAYFHYDWTLRSGELVPFDVCDIFVLNTARKIRELRIIYHLE